VNFDQPPDGVEWNDWGPPVRVSIDAAPVMLFARAVKDDAAAYASERAARDAGFERVPVPPTFTFVMANAGAFPDLQPADGTGSMYPSPDADSASRFGPDGLFLHGEQHFTYHRPVSVGDVLEGRKRTSKPITRAARRGPMEVTYFQTAWTDLERRPVVDERNVSLFFPNV
jgi:peroxisomal enoyl-CoA hydratase 2